MLGKHVSRVFEDLRKTKAPNINMFRILTILKAGRLLNIYFFLDRAIEEGTLHFHLI
jgi:hypothetical protein